MASGTVTRTRFLVTSKQRVGLHFYLQTIKQIVNMKRYTTFDKTNYKSGFTRDTVAQYVKANAVFFHSREFRSHPVSLGPVESSLDFSCPVHPTVVYGCSLA